jgi:hypothetical protein
LVFMGTHRHHGAQGYMQRMPNLRIAAIDCPILETEFCSRTPYRGEPEYCRGGPGFEHPTLQKLQCHAHSLPASFIESNRNKLPQLCELLLDTRTTMNPVRTPACLKFFTPSSDGSLPSVRVGKIIASWIGCDVRIFRHAPGHVRTTTTDLEWYNLGCHLPALSAVDEHEMMPEWLALATVGLTHRPFNIV